MQILNEQYSFSEYLLGNYYMLWNTAGVKTDKNPSSCSADILVVKKDKMHEWIQYLVC